MVKQKMDENTISHQIDDLPKFYLQHATDCLEAKTARWLNDDNLEEHISKNGFSFIIHMNLPTAKKHKPLKVENPREPLLPPYPIHRLCEHYNSHYIFINKNMLCKGHVVISDDSKEHHQTDPLNLSDCDALSHVMNGFKGIGIGYYNCGIDSGCSQIHKHLQFVPFEKHPILDLMADEKKLPFIYYIKKIEKYEATQIYSAYNELIKFIKNSECYNFICGMNSVILIPRRIISNEAEVVINALGFCGHIMCRAENVESVRDDPMKTLVFTGFPVS